MEALLAEMIRLLAQPRSLRFGTRTQRNILRLDRAFLMLMKTQGDVKHGECSLQHLNSSQDWKKHREGKTENPLRISLLKCLILELRRRAQTLIDSSGEVPVGSQDGMAQPLSDQGSLLDAILTCDAKAQADKPVENIGPLPHSDAVKALDQIMDGAFPLHAPSSAGPPGGRVEPGAGGRSGLRCLPGAVPSLHLPCGGSTPPGGHGEKDAARQSRQRAPSVNLRLMLFES